MCSSRNVFQKAAVVFTQSTSSHKRTSIVSKNGVYNHCRIVRTLSDTLPVAVGLNPPYKKSAASQSHSHRYVYNQQTTASATAAEYLLCALATSVLLRVAMAYTVRHAQCVAFYQFHNYLALSQKRL